MLTHEFEAGTSATAITKYFHDKLVAAGFDMKPYQPGDTQLFFNKVCKLDGAYSHGSAKTTFGWGETPVVIDDREYAVSGPAARRYRVGSYYVTSRPALSDLNDYVSWINTTRDGDIERLKTLHGLGAEGTLMLTRHLGVGVGYQMLAGSASGRSTGGAFGIDVDMQGAYALARAESRLGSSRFSLRGQGSLGYYRADSTISA